MFINEFSGVSMFSNFAVPLFYIHPPWYLMQYNWLVPSMRLQVIKDSLFSCLGSGPFSGRSKRESRNRTRLEVTHYLKKTNNLDCLRNIQWSRVQSVDQIVSKFSPVAQKFSVKRNGWSIDGLIYSYHVRLKANWVNSVITFRYIFPRIDLRKENEIPLFRKFPFS